jgi:hypothetical protein
MMVFVLSNFGWVKSYGLVCRVFYCDALMMLLEHASYGKNDNLDISSTGFEGLYSKKVTESSLCQAQDHTIYRTHHSTQF